MNLKDAYNAAVRLHAKINKYKLVSAALQNRTQVVPQWSSEFIKLFESLDFEERKLLREIEQYQILLEVYDVLIAGDPLTAFVIQNASQALIKASSYVNANNPFIKGGAQHGDKDAVEITFPIASMKSTTFELTYEVDWFFKLFNRSSDEFSDNDNKPTVLSIDNIDLSVAVSIDWKFLLVILLIWTKLQKHGNDTQEIKAAIDTLVKKGLDDKKAEDLEKELDKQSEELIDEVIKEYEKIAGEQAKAGWQSSFTQFAQHLFKAKDRGYHLEFMAGRDSKGAVLPGRPEGFIETVQRLSYTRENDWGGAGRTELLSKPKAGPEGG